MSCGAVDKAMIGRRELWMHCSLLPRHDGLHHDPKRPTHYWQETFYPFEFEYHRPKVKESGLKSKSKKCQNCGLHFSPTASFLGFCVCKDVRPGQDSRQKLMFATAEAATFWEAENRDLDEFFERIIAEDAERMANDPDAYFGEF